MKFFCLSALALPSSSSAVEENVVLQSHVVTMPNVETVSDGKLSHLSIGSDGEPVKKKKQLEVLLEHTSRFEVAVKQRIAGQEVSSIDENLIEQVMKTTAEIISALFADKANQQVQATESNDAIKRANDKLDHDITGAAGVDELRIRMQEKRDDHITCRLGQVEIEKERDEKCQEYAEYAQKTHEGRPDCQCQTCVNGPALDADDITSCYQQGEAWVAKFEDKLQRLKDRCDMLKAKFVKKKTHCDAQQGFFENRYCKYSDKWRVACVDFDLAIGEPNDGLVKQRTELLTKLEHLEAKNKATFVATKNLQCMMTLYADPANCTPQALAACHTAVYDPCPDPDTPDTCLDMIYPTLLDPAVCDASAVDKRPGDPEWAEAEYTSCTWAHLVVDVTPCDLVATTNQRVA